MGRLINGINGPIAGKVGTVVGSSRNGVPYIKARYKKRTKRVSKEELANRNKFAMAQSWLQPILDFVREGFKGYSQRAQGFVAAKSFLLKNAMEGTVPRINPALMKVSYGDLPLPQDMAVSKSSASQLEFTWDGKNVNDNGYDQVMMLAYDVERKMVAFETTGQFRKTGRDILDLPGATGRKYHVYMAFVAADRSRQSDSVYLGEIKV